MQARLLGPLFLLGGCILFSAGCSGKVGPSVKGQVLLDGQPVAEARLTFEGKGGATAVTDKDGKFFLDGTVYMNVKPGKYVVKITKYVDATGKAVPPEEYEQLLASGTGKNVIPEIYDQTEGNPLSVDITDGLNELPPFQLKTKK